MAVLSFGYFFWFYSTPSQTIGRRITGTRVIRADLRPLTLTTIAARESVNLLLNSIGLIALGATLLRMEESEFLTIPETNRSTQIFSESSLLVSVIFVAAFWAFVDGIALIRSSEKRSLHDWIAGTRVILTNAAIPTVSLLLFLLVGSDSFAGSPAIDLKKLGVNYDAKPVPLPRDTLRPELLSVGTCDGKNFTDLAALESCPKSYERMQPEIRSMMNQNTGSKIAPAVTVPAFAPAPIAIPSFH